MPVQSCKACQADVMRLAYWGSNKTMSGREYLFLVKTLKYHYKKMLSKMSNCDRPDLHGRWAEGAQGEAGSSRGQ